MLILRFRVSRIIPAATLSMLFSLGSDAQTLGLTVAEQLAMQEDFGARQLMAESRASLQEADAQSQLPDPQLVLGALNLPTDTFKFDQEPMTQFKVGVKQMFPQGDTLPLKERKFRLQSDAQAHAARGRLLMVTRQVRKGWLEVFYWERARSILSQDENLFRQILDVTHSLYSVGHVQQQDVLRAELELSRLKEKIIKAERSAVTERAQLARWIGERAMDDEWPEVIPVVAMPTVPNIPDADSRAAQTTFLSNQLKTHPMLQALSGQVDVAAQDIALSQQLYKPTWGVELSYGYRAGQNNDGSDRADFLSAAVNVSLPLFTSSRQDKSVQRANYKKYAQQNAYADKLAEMRGEVEALQARLAQVDAQLTLFDEQILTKASLHAEAALNAYQADASDFAEVMRAFLSEQRDRLDYERLLVTRLQLISDLQFYLGNHTPELPEFSEINLGAFSS